MKGLWIAAVAAVGIASSAWGTTDVPVTFEASITAEGRMELRVTSNSEFVTRGNLEVQQGREDRTMPLALVPDAASPVPEDVRNIPMTLVPGVAIAVIVDVRPDVEDVVVRYFMESGTAAAVDVIHLGSDSAGRRRVVSASQREEARAAQLEQSLRKESAERARKSIKAILATGRKPGLDLEEGIFAQEWNKAVRELAPETRNRVGAQADGPCGPYTLSSYNYSYPLRGNFGYVDEYPYAHNVRPWMPGLPVRVVVQQDWEDPCGYVLIRERFYNTTSGNNGAFSFSSVTSLEYYGDNPVHRFEVTTQYVGLRSGSTMNAYTHILYSYDQMNFYWNGSEAVIDPYFSSSNSSYPFFFRWEDEIRYQKNQWAAYGFNSYFTPFRAGYEGNGSNGARFYPVSPGMVIFDSAGRWSSGFVMAHEIGHHFQFRLQGDVWAGAGPVHSICQILADPDGFNEGFANWYGAFWNDEGADAKGVNCFSGECYAVCSPSYRKEGNVMQYFWDIFDATNHATRDQGQDTIFRPLTILQNWRATGAYGSFPDWYDDFYWKGVWNGYESVVNTLRTVNGVHVP